MSQYADYIFRFLNFVVVFGIIAYLVRRYGVLQIVMMMRQEKKQQDDMKTDLKNLSSECEKLDQTKKDQEYAYRVMKDKFQIWQNCVEKSDKDELEKFEIRKQQIEQSQVQKLIALGHKKIMQQQLPDVVQQVTEELRQEFAQNSQQKKAYTNKVLDFIEKKQA